MTTNRFIPGIFNYCDYWCERCAFTQRCRNFAMGREFEREAKGEADVKDATNADFWNGLAETLRETTVFGKASEWEDADDLEWQAIPDSEWQARENARRNAVKAHPLMRQAETYRKCVDSWLKGADADLKALARELMEAAGNRFDDSDCEEEARRIGEMLDVVSWYHTLILPKLGRALSGLFERDDPESGCGDLVSGMRLSDATGTGKVVLIAIERSKAAWVRLREALPNREDDILHMLAILSKMERGIHAALPDAKSFRRPGFDGEPPETDEEDDDSTI